MQQKRNISVAPDLKRLRKVQNLQSPKGKITDADAKTVGASRYFNRELSWLKFNQRVLEEAANPAHPLLERLRFLSISGNNLDEFFMVRVAGLRGQQLRKIEELSIDGRTPSEQLSETVTAADALMAQQQKLWKQLKRQLAKRGHQGHRPGLRSARSALAAVEHLFPRTDFARADAASARPGASFSVHPQSGDQPDFRHAPHATMTRLCGNW